MVFIFLLTNRKLFCSEAGFSLIPQDGVIKKCMKKTERKTEAKLLAAGLTYR
jgi:hypothetical protein